MLEKSDGTALVPYGDQCPRPDDDKWSVRMLIFIVIMIAGIVIYIWRMMKKLWNKIYPTTRTVGTQSQTTYTALAHHATPRFTLVSDLRQGVFEDGRRIWGQVS